MEYFFIAGNVASLAALIGFLLQASHFIGDTVVLRATLALAVFLTVAFWLYFYFAPTNRVKKTVKERITFAGSYVDSSNNPIEVFEGEFTLSELGHSLAVPIPPFETPPSVTIYPIERNRATRPTINTITADSFDVTAMASDQMVTWGFRARGRQLLQRTKTS